ncbi:MAG: MFS transporter [Verrucomicrobiales bacterium]|nr:MFS transporter [Verrucomicrobiales bacterium]
MRIPEWGRADDVLGFFASGVCAGPVQRFSWWAGHADLALLFLVHGMAMATWYVPLSPVLEAYGFSEVRPLAFATSAVAALVSPLVFGGIADRQMRPSRVLRGLAIAASVLTVVAAWAIQARATSWGVLLVIQAHALVAVPTWSLTYTIALSRLKDSRREFGPIRALGTLGWMAGCWLVSLMDADASVRASVAGAAIWVVLALVLQTVRGEVPPESQGKLSIRQRLGLDALGLLVLPDHRVVFMTAALIAIPLSAFYPFTPLHLRALGLTHSSAWMSLGQVTELIAMFGLSVLLGRWRLKWIFACGLGFALVRYALCTVDSVPWVLTGVTLHGFAFTLFFITAPIYLNERIEAAWRGRAQALMTLMTLGVGNMLGYLGCGAWFTRCTEAGVTRWPLFWGGLTGAVAMVLLYFLWAYSGRTGNHKTAST